MLKEVLENLRLYLRNLNIVMYQWGPSKRRDNQQEQEEEEVQHQHRMNKGLSMQQVKTMIKVCLEERRPNKTILRTSMTKHVASCNWIPFQILCHAETVSKIKSTSTSLRASKIKDQAHHYTSQECQVLVRQQQPSKLSRRSSQRRSKRKPTERRTEEEHTTLRWEMLNTYISMLWVWRIQMQYIPFSVRKSLVEDWIHKLLLSSLMNSLRRKIRKGLHLSILLIVPIGMASIWIRKHKELPTR